MFLVSVLNLGWPWYVPSLGQKSDRVKLVWGSGRVSGTVKGFTPSRGKMDVDAIISFSPNNFWTCTDIHK